MTEPSRLPQGQVLTKEMAGPHLRRHVVWWSFGRRVSSILALEWTDWKPDLGKHGKLRWRAEEDKVGREWWSPVTPEVRAELEALRRERMAVGLGAVLLFPSVNDPTIPLGYKTATLWLRAAEKMAGLDPLPHGAFHPFRRRWASERKHLPLVDVAAAGGWVETTTLQRCYISSDDETMESVVLQPKRLGRKLRLGNVSKWRHRLTSARHIAGRSSLLGRVGSVLVQFGRRIHCISPVLVPENIS